MPCSGQTGVEPSLPVGQWFFSSWVWSHDVRCDGKGLIGYENMGKLHPPSRQAFVLWDIKFPLHEQFTKRCAVKKSYISTTSWSTNIYPSKFVVCIYHCKQNNGERVLPRVVQWTCIWWANHSAVLSINSSHAVGKFPYLFKFQSIAFPNVPCGLW